MGMERIGRIAVPGTPESLLMNPITKYFKRGKIAYQLYRTSSQKSGCVYVWATVLCEKKNSLVI
jgi:hypothetical protein